MDWFGDEDYYLWIRLTLAGKHMANLGDTLSYVRVGGRDVSTSAWLGDKHIENKRTIVEADTWIASQSIVKQGVILRRMG